MDSIQCTACRTMNAATASFCNGCGAALAVPSAAVNPVDEAPMGAAPSGWALATAGMGLAPETSDPASGPLRKDELAAWWPRFGGYLLDGLIAFGALLLLWGALGMFMAVSDPDALSALGDWFETDEEFPAVGDGWIGLFFVVTFAGYFAWEVLWLRSEGMGRPGQRIAGFRVVRASDVSRLTTGRALGRAAAKLIYNIPQLGTLFWIASAFTIGLSDRKQGLHDMLGGTACVRKDALARRGIGPDAANVGMLPSQLPGMPTAPPTSTWGTPPSSSPPYTPPPNLPPSQGPFV
jgi:uncharacterized RDD family membrane protein YckC